MALHPGKYPWPHSSKRPGLSYAGPMRDSCDNNAAHKAKMFNIIFYLALSSYEGLLRQKPTRLKSSYSSKPKGLTSLRKIRIDGKNSPLSMRPRCDADTPDNRLSSLSVSSDKSLFRLSILPSLLLLVLMVPPLSITSSLFILLYWF